MGDVGGRMMQAGQNGNRQNQSTFHWRLLQGGEKSGTTRAGQHSSPETGLPDLPAQVEFCRKAEESGIESVLVDINFAKPEPIMLSTALGSLTEKMKFMVAIRSGLISPTLLTQQINTLSMLTNGRVSLNVVAGHSPDEQRYYGDWLEHDERYARTGEFLHICHRLWSGTTGFSFAGRYFQVEDARINTPFISETRRSPEIFIGGSSDQAQQLAIAQGTCWMRFAGRPADIAESGAAVRDAGKQLGLRLSVVAERTREMAVEAAHAVVENLDPKLQHRRVEEKFVERSDSSSMHSGQQMAGSEWLTPYLWTGAVRTNGAPAMALVGSPHEVASAIMEYKRAGVTHFIFSGWPKQESMTYFGREVVPLVREFERAEAAYA
jgi:alkanesulfonate monooxygenase